MRIGDVLVHLPDFGPDPGIGIEGFANIPKRVTLHNHMNIGFLVSLAVRSCLLCPHVGSVRESQEQRAHHQADKDCSFHG